MYSYVHLMYSFLIAYWYSSTLKEIFVLNPNFFKQNSAQTPGLLFYISIVLSKLKKKV